MSEIEKDDIVDLTESEESPEKDAPRKLAEKKEFKTTRSQTLLTRSGKRRKTVVGIAKKRDLRLRKTARQNKLESKKDDSDKTCGENVTNSTNTESDMETQEPVEGKAQKSEENKSTSVSEGQSCKNQNESTDKNCGKLLPDIQNDDESKNNNDKNFELSESPVVRQEKELDETPRKIPDKTFTSGCTLFESQSDTKLMLASRKFDKSRHVVARRSILKQPSPSQNSVEESSPVTGKKFHPIKVGNVHSPSASPSAGILKKRRLSGDIATNSPSPPGKQRRVCFAHPLTMEQEAENNANQDSSVIKTAASPLVTASRVSFSSEKNGKDSQLTPTQNSYQSTQESQLNNTDPIYPELLECSEKVDKILPQLTTSMWMRGLGQLVRARNIHTIGDLSALTEREVDNLPIKSPKVSIVRSVLQKFETQKEARKVKNQKLDTTTTNKKDKVPIEGDISGEGRLTSLKNPTTDKDLDMDMPVLAAEKDCDDVEPATTSSQDMLDSDDYAAGLCAVNGHLDIDNTSPSAGAGSLLNSLEDIVRQCNDKATMREFKTADIFQIHHHLTNLTSTVMTVLKDRCQCPEDKS